MSALCLGEIATRFGCRLVGDPDATVERVATLRSAGPGTLSFLANPKYRRYLTDTRAGAVLLAEDAAGSCPTNALIAEDPYATYALVAQLLHPDPPAQPGVHPAAWCSPEARVDPMASVGPGAVVEAGAVIEARAVIGANCVVERDARIGADTRLHAHATVCHGVRLGQRVVVHPGAVIGADGFGYAWDRERWLKVPQVGSVVVGDDADIGAGTTIDRGAVEDTVIEEGVKLDNQIQVAHNVRIGAHTIIAACSGISGSTTIGKRCLIGGAAGFVGHLSICDDVTITGQTMVNRSITEPGVYSSALPMDEAGRWRKNSARFRRLDDLARTVKRLQKKLGDDD